MITYEVTCRYCRQPVKLVEGSKKYAQYKKNRQAKFSCDSCDSCDRKVEDDSRKYLFDRD